MPVAVSKLHVISDGIGKTLTFFSIILTKGLVDDHFNIFTQVIEAGIPFGIRKSFGLCLKGFPGGYGIGAINF